MGTDIPPPTALPWCNMYVFPSLDEDTVAMMTMPDDLPAELQNLMLREVRREGAVCVCVCVCVRVYVCCCGIMYIMGAMVHNIIQWEVNRETGKRV